jgi:hypothetical protein
MSSSMHSLYGFLVVLAFVAFAVHADPKAPVELRGVWLKPENTDTPAKRAELYRKLETANLNTVFLAAWGDMNAFREFMDESHKRGWAVHGWICNHYRTPNVDFASLSEQAAQRDWAMGILDQYPALDGMHFDYIREKNWGPCDRAKMDGISTTIRITNEAIKRRYPGKFLTAAVFTAATQNYIGFKQPDGRIQWDGDVPEWYRTWWQDHPDNWYTKIPQLRPDLLQNGVFGPIQFHFQQDPVTWIRTGALDAVMPMQYSTNDNEWNAEADMWMGFLGDLTPQTVYMGLGWWSDAGPIAGPGRQGYDAAALVRHIKYGRSRGYKGFVIFSLGYVPQKDWEFIEALSTDSAVNGGDAPFKEPAVSPLLAPPAATE